MKCRDCNRETDQGHEFCSRCLAIWHIENEVDENVPCADFDEPRYEF